MSIWMLWWDIWDSQGYGRIDYDVCLLTTRFVLANDSSIEEFVMGRGLRHIDLLFMFLFLITEGGFNVMLNAYIRLQVIILIQTLSTWPDISNL